MSNPFEGRPLGHVEITHAPAGDPPSGGGGDGKPEAPPVDPNLAALEGGGKPKQLGGRGEKGKKGGKTGEFMQGKVRKEGEGKKEKKKKAKKEKAPTSFTGAPSLATGLTVRQQKRLDKALGRGIRRKTEKSAGGTESPGCTIQQLAPADAALLSYRAVHTQLLNKGARSDILQRITNSYGETTFQDVEKLDALLASVGGDKPSQVKEICDRLRAAIGPKLVSPKGQSLLFWRRDTAPLPPETQEQITELWIYLKMTGIVTDGKPNSEHKRQNVLGAQIENTLKMLRTHSEQQKLAQDAVGELERVKKILADDKTRAKDAPDKLAEEVLRNHRMRVTQLNNIIKSARQPIPRTLITFIQDMPLFKSAQLSPDELAKIATNESQYPAVPFETRHPPEKRQPTPEEKAAREKAKKDRRRERVADKKAKTLEATSAERQRKLELDMQTYDGIVQEALSQRRVISDQMKLAMSQTESAEIKEQARRIFQPILDAYAAVLDLAKRKGETEPDINKRTYRPAQALIQDGGTHGVQSFNDKLRLIVPRIEKAREELRKIIG